MLCFTWVVSSLLSCCYLSSSLLTLPRAYLLCLSWVVSSVVIFREEYLTKPYYKPGFSQWVASSKFVEFLNYFNCYNRGFCFELFFSSFFIGNSTHGTQNILQFKEFEFSFVAPDFLN